MSEQRLYCTQCGREYRPRPALEGVHLHCAGCSGPLAGRSERGAAAPEDRFRGRVIGGARLRKLVAVRPTHFVYRAVHRQLRTHVRVDLFPNEFAQRNAEYMERLFHAAAATREIGSTYVITLLDIGRRTDFWHIVLEWTPSDLRELLERRAPLTVNRALSLTEAVLAGLDAVHAAGRVHWNISPEGVRFAHDGSPKLDYLATRPRAEQLDRLVLSPGGCLSGPALYIAPERAAGQEGDIRSDLYSLGATAFEMLAGFPAHRARSAMEVLAPHAGEGLPDLREARPEVPDEIAEFVHRLMAPDPSRRPANPREALEELRELGVDLSRRRKIGPVAASLSEAQQLRSAVRWTAAWAVVALLLVALAVIPGLLMCREHWRGEQPGGTAAVSAASTVVVAVERAGSSPADPLPADRTSAVGALLNHALAFYPAFEPAEADSARALLEAGRTPAEACASLGAGYALTASHAAGLERRRWTLTFARPGKRGWALSRQCAVEEDQPDGLAPLEQAAGELLAAAALRAGAKGPPGVLPITGAAADAWARYGEALGAERRGSWEEAFVHARAAAQGAPQSAAFALLAAFYDSVRGGAETGRFAALPALPPQDLPPQMASLAEVVNALADGDDALVAERFGEHLARFPRSARGYWLMGMWRLKAQGRAEEALVAFRHALDIDPDYVPARDAANALAAGPPGGAE